MNFKRIIAAGIIFATLGTSLYSCALGRPTVSGQVTFPRQTVLPEGAVLNVQVQDTSRADAPDATLADQTIQINSQQLPTDFALAYDPTKIDPTHTYRLVLRVEDGQGNSLLTNDQAVRVITRAAPTSGIQVTLVAVASVDANKKALTANPWLLTQFGSQPLLSGTQITAIFSPDDKLTGSAGCNAYNAPYQAQGSQLSIGKTVTTLLACGPTIMQQESNFLQALAATSSYAVSAGSLALFDPDGKSLAVFAAQGLDLAGSSWLVSSYNNGKGGLVSVLPGTQIDATFGTDGNIGGSAGCNDYFAPFSVKGTAIEVDAPVTTKVLCTSPEGIMQQETSYLLALESAVVYELSSSSLVLKKGDGTTAVAFTRAP